MKLWQAEKQAFDDLAGAETLGDIMRIGFNRVNFTDKAGKYSELYELSGDNKASGTTWGKDYRTESVEISTDILIDSDSVELDKDEDGYTIISVKEKAED